MSVGRATSHWCVYSVIATAPAFRGTASAKPMSRGMSLRCSATSIADLCGATFEKSEVRSPRWRVLASYSNVSTNASRGCQRSAHTGDRRSCPAHVPNADALQRHDLLQQFLLTLAAPSAARSLTSGLEDACCLVQQLRLLRVALAGVHAVPSRQLGERMLLSQGLKRHLGLERCIASISVVLHRCCSYLLYSTARPES